MSKVLINARKVDNRIFDSVADMVADTNLAIGNKCRTLGYYLVGDGGGNDYEIVAAGTGTDDGGSYIDLGTHQAKGLFVSGDINPYQFGADGVDDTTAWVNAISYSSANNLNVTGLGHNFNITSLGNLPAKSNIFDAEFTHIRDTTTPIVIAATGQSNMGGTIGLGGTFKTNANVQVWCSTTQFGTLAFREVDLSTTEYWQPAQTVDSNFGNGYNNLAVSFCHRLQERTSRPVYLIMDSIPNATLSTWLSNGIRSVELDTAITAGLAALSLTKIDVMLWHQGEDDSANTSYTSELDSLITDYRSRSWMDNSVPFLTGLLISDNGTYTTQNKRLFQFSLNGPTDYWGNVPATSINSQTADSHGLTVFDTVNFDGPGLFEFGYYKYFEALVKVGKLLPYMATFNIDEGKLIRTKWNCSNGCNGILISNANDIKIDDIYITKFIEKGLGTETKAGRFSITNARANQYKWGDTGYNLRSARTGIGFDISTADGFIDYMVSSYTFCPIRFSSLYNFQANNLHPFNDQSDGGSLDSTNVIIESDVFGLIATNSYFDKGKVVIHSPANYLLGGIVGQGSGENNITNFELVSHALNQGFAPLSIVDFKMPDDTGTVGSNNVMLSNFLNGSHNSISKFTWRNNVRNNKKFTYAGFQDLNSKISIDGNENILSNESIYRQFSNNYYDFKHERGLRLVSDYNDNSGNLQAEIIFATHNINRWKITGAGQFAPYTDLNYNLGTSTLRLSNIYTKKISLIDGITAPSATADNAQIFVDIADGDLKVVFGDGTIKTIIVDT